MRQPEIPSKAAAELARPRFPAWLPAVPLVLATILAYQPAWRAGFIWDDDDYVTANPLLTARDGLWRIWFSMDSPSQYFPLTYTVFRLEHALWGLNPAGYHWVNILLHAASALLVWRLLGRLAVPGAWLAAAIFALHPVQVESVAWITELKNVLMGFFCLLAMLAWVEFLDEHSKQRWRFYALALVFYVAALCAKTTACTLPAALLLIIWLQSKPLNGRRVLEVAPFGALGVGMGLLTMWWERFHQGTQGRLFSMSLIERCLVASHAVWFYAGKLAWPVNLMFSYPHWTINAADPWSYGWLVATAGLGAAIYWARRRTGTSVAVGVLFFVMTLAPVLGFIMLYTFVYSFVADHYQYLASIGLIALFAAGLAQLAARLKPKMPWLEAAVCLGLPLTLAVLTWNQAHVYQDSEALWRDTLAKNPASWMAQNNLGSALQRKGQLDEAILQYFKTLRMKPDYAEARSNLGSALMEQGKIDDAIGQFEEAVRLKPNIAQAHYNLGTALLVKRRIDEAIGQFEEAVRLKPNYAEARNNLGTAIYSTGQRDEAIRQFREAIRLKPDFALAQTNLASVLSMTNPPAGP
jgi:tetratricopeptide (TPR) repeat protein